MSTETTPSRSNDWLLQHARNVHSQRGEDGILEEVFKHVSGTERWCVEFGAWDGVHLSNTHYLMEQGWSGVFIEADPVRFKDLKHSYQNNSRAHCICTYVHFAGPDTLDNLLARTPIPADFDLLSIDIDGNDYHMWESVERYTPKVVIIEFNPTIPADVEFVQPKDMSINQGNSLLSLTLLGKRKGYELVCATLLNAIFVRKEFFPAFGIVNNSPSVLFTDERYQTKFFQLYDGTIVLTGARRLLWHGIPIRSRDLALLPRPFRMFQERMGPIRLFLFKVWRRMRRLLS